MFSKQKSHQSGRHERDGKVQHKAVGGTVFAQSGQNGGETLTVFKNYELFTLQDIGLIAVGFIAAFLAGFLAIKSLLKFVSSKNYVPFAYYRIVFGGLIPLTSHMGWVKWTA